MYTSFEIKNFRLFKDFKIEPLGKINLIGGRNNVGKTSLLEALLFLSSPTQPEYTYWIRSLPIGIFNDLNAGTLVELEAKDKRGHVKRLTIEAVQNPSSESVPITSDDNALQQNRMLRGVKFAYKDTNTEINELVSLALQSNDQSLQVDRAEIKALPTVVFRSPRSDELSSVNIIDAFSELERRRQSDDLFIALRSIAPELRDIRLLSEGKQTAFYCDVGKPMLIPIELMGDGFLSIFEIMVMMFKAAPNGVILVDEIENGIHHAVLEQVWTHIGQFALAQGVQIFATTHSDECIDAAYRAFKDADENTFRYHRLDRLKDGTIEAVTFGKLALQGAIKAGFEVR